MITEQLSTRATRNISSTRSWPTFPLVHDVLNLWCIRVVTGDISDLSALSIDRLYPLSALQCVILADITGALLYCRDVQHNPASDDDQQSTSWSMYRVLPGKPGTGKSQVLIRAIHHATENRMSVFVTAPVDDMNYGLNRFDFVVVGEASMILAPTFQALAKTFNRLNLCPVVVFPGDKYQQQPLETVGDRVSATTSIINDQQTFHAGNAIKNFLYQQFRIVDEEYAKFLDLICYTQPTQEQLDRIQHDMILCPEGDLSDEDIWQAFQSRDVVTIMTVSRRGAQRINNIALVHLLEDQCRLSRIPCASVAKATHIYPVKDMKVLFTENDDKDARIVNGQEATIISAQNNTIIFHLPEGLRLPHYTYRR